jgi:O-antigen/teichoic acid export membrane protein
MCSGMVVALTAIACFGALIAQDFVRHFLHPRFAAAGRVVPWIIGAYLAHALFSLFSLAVLQARRTPSLMAASFIALAANTVLNFALIPRWGMYGAARATLAAYGIEAAVMYVLAQRTFRLEYDLLRTSAAMGVFAGVLAVTQLPWNAGMRPMAFVAAGLVAMLLLLALGLNRIRLLFPGSQQSAISHQ